VPTDPPDIVLFGSFPSRGGICRRLANMIQVWAERGFGVAIVAFRGGKLFYPDEIGELVAFEDLASRGRLASVYRLWRYLRRERPHALLATKHTANVVAALAAALPGSQTRCILSVASPYGRPDEDSAPGSRARKLREVRQLYPLADTVVSISDGVREDLLGSVGLKGVPVTTIYNAAVAPTMRLRAREPTGHRWLEDHEVPVVLSAGRLAREKDFPTLIRAFARLLEVRDARLILLGEGPERPRLESLARDLGIAERVDLPGHVPNPYAYMARADVFALSSLWEGFGNVLAEALYLGAPVVATECPGGPREILAGGRYGQLVPVGDAEAMASCLKRALGGAAPRVDADEACHRFLADPVAEAYLRVFGLAGGAAGR
jgi:glycosyltransferase involved in cell wall biosynthesis